VIYVAENERPELAEDEYMVTDLVGMKAYLDPARQQYVGEVVGVVVMDDLGTVAAKGQVSVLHYYCV
jgi:ribosomal 30S subunit maturation factor RimM